MSVFVYAWFGVRVLKEIDNLKIASMIEMMMMIIMQTVDTN